MAQGDNTRGAREEFASWQNLNKAKELNWEKKTVPAPAATTEPTVETFQNGHYHYKGCPKDTFALYSSQDCKCKDVIAAHSKVLADKAFESKDRNVAQQIAVMYFSDSPDSQAVRCLIREGRARLREKFATELCLEVGGTKIQDLGEILRWLVESCQLTRWSPENPAIVDKILAWRLKELKPAVVKKDQKALEACLNKLESEFLAEGKFLGGSAVPTIADLAVRPSLTGLSLKPKIQAFVDRFDARVLTYASPISDVKTQSQPREVASQAQSVRSTRSKSEKGGSGEVSYDAVERRLFQLLAQRQESILQNLDSLLDLYRTLADKPSETKPSAQKAKPAEPKAKPAETKAPKAAAPAPKPKEKEVKENKAPTEAKPAEHKAKPKEVKEVKAQVPKPEAKPAVLEIKASTSYTPHVRDRFEGNLITHLVKLAMASNAKLANASYNILGFVQQAPFYAVKLDIGGKVTHFLLTRPEPTEGKVTILATSEGDSQTVPASLLSQYRK